MTDDILSYFLQLERDGKLSREEILNICILFLPAGLDTVTDTLECSFAFLSRHPAYRQQLADDPDAGRTGPRGAPSLRDPGTRRSRASP